MEPTQTEPLPEEELPMRSAHPRSHRVRRMPRILGDLGRKLTPSLSTMKTSTRGLFYQTTREERIVVLASFLAIVFTFFPWVSISNIQINGWNNFLYSLAILIVLSSLVCMWTVLWSALGRELPKFMDSSSKVHIILGAEIIQVGLIIFTLLVSYGNSFSVSTTENISSMPILIVFAGVAILGAGLFERQGFKKSRAHTVVIPHLHSEPEEEQHDLDKILHRKEQEHARAHDHTTDH